MCELARSTHKINHIFIYPSNKSLEAEIGGGEQPMSVTIALKQMK